MDLQSLSRFFIELAPAPKAESPQCDGEYDESGDSLFHRPSVTRAGGQAREEVEVRRQEESGHGTQRSEYEIPHRIRTDFGGSCVGLALGSGGSS